MLIGISNKQDVLKWFIRYTDNQYQDPEDEALVQCLIAKAEELISEDVDYWANESVRKLHNTALDILAAGNPKMEN